MRADDINSLEAESGVIATLIHHPDWVYQAENLLPNHFTNKQNRCIYIAIQNLVDKGIKQIDAFNILESLGSKESTKRFVDELTIDGLQEFIALSDVLCRSSENEYEMLASNIIDSAFRRSVFTVLGECQADCFDRSKEDLAQDIYTRIDEVMVNFTSSDDIPEFSDVADDIWQEIESHQDGNESGIPFKFPSLNDYVTLEKQELVVVGAPKKGAKSMFMLNEAVDLMKRDKTVMYIDSELSDRLFMCRLVSHLTKIEFVRVRTGRYNDEEREKIREALLWIKSKKLVHLYMPIFETNAIYRAVKKVSHKFGKLDVLIVDYLKATGDTDAFATYAELGKLTDLIKNNIAGAMDIAALAAAQLTDGGKLADSAKIARNASTVILLLDKTNDELAADGVNCGNKKLIVQFNRNGAQHTSGEYIDIQFDGNYISLTEAEAHLQTSPY